MSCKDEDEWTKCPYYQFETKRAIHCEGVQEGVGLHLGFASKPVMRAYQNSFCRDNWCGCMIAKMLNLKYDYVP